VHAEAYLCISPYRGTYPSANYPDFEAEEHILASGAGATPLLWLAMYRSGDLASGTTDMNAENGSHPIPATGLIAPRQRALTNLYTAVPVLDRLLGESVTDHAELLREAIRWLPGAWVTIEWWVDDKPARPPHDTDLLRALAAFDAAEADHTDGQAALARLSRLRLGEPLAPARLLLDSSTPSIEDRSKLERMLGRSHMRMVPWEIPI
jgi:hypothetical protein